MVNRFVFSQELDARERALMLSQGMTADAARFMAEASGNVALDGNFSIQVRHRSEATFPIRLLKGSWGRAVQFLVWG
jgi:hypothetical protein